MGILFVVIIVNIFMYYYDKDIIEQYFNYFFFYWRFIDDIFVIQICFKDIFFDFLEVFISKIVLAIVVYFFWIYFFLEMRYLACYIFLFFKSFLKNVCIYFNNNNNK